MAALFVGKVLSLTLLSGFALGSVDHCRSHTFKNVKNRTSLVFSKENSEREFGIVDRFKSVHCCSHGYRSIEWFKDGKPYPWPTDVSTLIISPESGNQTIYSQSISEMDSGTYWCVVRNDTHSLKHEVLLKVSGSSELEGPPKATYRPRNKIAILGGNVRFYCEAFVGNISLPDAKSEISWKKLGVNSSIFSDRRIRERIVSRDENQVLGSYLFIANVRKEDFGSYVCRVSNTGDQFLDLNASLTAKDKTGPIILRVPIWLFSSKIKRIFVPLSCTALISVSLVRFRSRIKLLFQKLFDKNYVERIAESDVLVIYHADDKDTALNQIVFTLQNSYNYTCNVFPTFIGKLDGKDLKEKANHSKRIIILLSTAITENDWSGRKLYLILQNLINIHPRIIAVFLKPLPTNEPQEQTGALQALLQRVYCINYNEAELQKFWYLMTLGLPAPSLVLDSRENVELV